ncbi:hypothetical protein AGLY_018181 [Aphis glycines]|uniref:Pre-C2HC domain-containing protein n=1 Tax=Aphis glycines TaxID=307491 RepID=A0A6G0STW9_APHGL|nr:hypothetical protein AGLY_018181 [Aphis glycines]
MIGKQSNQILQNAQDLPTALLLPQKNLTKIFLFRLTVFLRLLLLTKLNLWKHQVPNTNPVINLNENNTSKPPPIFIQKLINYNNFCQKINELTDETGVDCKSSTKGLKLQTYSPISYRSVVSYLKNTYVSFHSFQLKEEKAYRVVIRNMYHTTETSLIKQELLNKGFVTRSITPVTNKLTNTPLPIFIIDLEPCPTNSDIFKLTSLCYTKIKVETPHPKKEIPQYHRCQNYGHTRSYCNHSPRCVRCAEQHESTVCTKDHSSPAKCALCSDNPSKKICNKSSLPRQSTVKNTYESTHQAYSQNFLPLNQDSFSHSHDNNSKDNHNENISAQLSSFINEFKALINPLISLLTTLFGYDIIRADHPYGTAHRGAALLISNKIDHLPLPPYLSPNIQAASTSIKINSITISISSCYFPPGRPFLSVELSNLSQTLSFTHVIGADFNAKFHTWSRTTNTRGRALNNFISLNHLKVIAPHSPTYWPSHGNHHPDTLDFFITNLPNRFSTELANLNDSAPDHTPVLLLIGAQPTLKQNRPTITPGTTNWNKFRVFISNKIILNTKLKSSSDVHQAITQLSDSLLKTHKANLYKNHLQNLSLTNGSLWRKTKSILRIKDSPPPLRRADNSLASTDKEKADILAEELSGVFKLHLIPTPVPHMSSIMETLHKKWYQQPTTWYLLNCDAQNSAVPSLPLKLLSPRRSQHFRAFETLLAD